MLNEVKRWCDDQSGATAIEYAIVASLISIAIITSVTIVGTKLSAKFSAIATNL